MYWIMWCYVVLTFLDLFFTVRFFVLFIFVVSVWFAREARFYCLLTGSSR